MSSESVGTNSGLRQGFHISSLLHQCEYGLSKKRNENGVEENGSEIFRGGERRN